MTPPAKFPDRHFPILGPVLFLAAWVSSLAAAATPAPVYTMAAPARWVEVTEASFPEQAPVDQIVDGIHRIRIERQCDPATESIYHHEVHRIVSETGIQSGSDLRLTFDPSYEKVTLHRLRVRRGAAWEDRLENTPINVIQREEDLDYHLLDGRLMLVIHLEDIRVGDAVEWSWTVTGTNPGMAGCFFDSFNAVGNHPVHELRLRVLVPATRDIRYKLHEGAPAPVVKKTRDGQEWLWNWQMTPSWHEESSLPSWYNSKPWIDLGEHPDWAATVKWALPLYTVPTPSSPSWNALVENCRSQATPEQQVLRALRFVQDEIRYLGIEMGAGSHRPNPPALVLKRRFGDCKDKSLLLISLLRALGHQAWPAFVNTDSRHSIESWLPSPYDFDHVVVALEWEGGLLFLDPTRSLQRGPLKQIYIEDYGRTLLVRPGETGLVDLHPQPGSLPRMEVTETYLCPSLDGETTLQVHTIHRGASAEEARSDLAGSSLQNIQEDYLEYYANAHPLIRTAAPVSWKDDPATNTVESTESYVIGGLWKKTGTGSYEADFYPQYIRDVLEKPGQAVRQGPFAVTHPTDVTQETRIELWEPWNIRPGSRTLNSPVFQYTYSSSVENGGQTIVFRDHYRTKKDHATPAEAAEYLKAVENVLRDLGHTLEYNTSLDPLSGAAGSRGLLAVCLLLAGLASAGWALAVRRSPTTGVPPPLPGHPPDGTPWRLLRVPLFMAALTGIAGLVLHPIWAQPSPNGYTQADFFRMILLAAPVWPLWAMLRRQSRGLAGTLLAWTGWGILALAVLFPCGLPDSKGQLPVLVLQAAALAWCGFNLAHALFRSRRRGTVRPCQP